MVKRKTKRQMAKTSAAALTYPARTPKAKARYKKAAKIAGVGAGATALTAAGFAAGVVTAAPRFNV